MKTIVAAALLGFAGAALPLAARAQPCDLPQPGAACLVDPTLRAQAHAQDASSGVSFLGLAANGSGLDAVSRLAAGLPGNRAQEMRGSPRLLAHLDDTGYHQVALGLGETGLNSMLSLDRLQVWGAGRAGAQRASNAGTLADDLHGLAPNWVLLNAALSAHAPGRASTWFYLPDALVSQYQYLYLHSLFGRRAPADGSFNWLAFPASVFAVPEPSTAWLLALGFLALVVLRRARYAPAL